MRRAVATEIVKIAAPVVAELVSVSLFISMVAVWALIFTGGK
jgi:hypothetical protein